MRQAHALERQLQRALYEWLTEQAPGASFEALRPNRKPVTVASTLAELDELEKEWGLDEEEDELEGRGFNPALPLEFLHFWTVVPLCIRAPIHRGRRMAE